MNFELRPETEDDVEFLARLYASTRAEEVAQTGWSAEQQRHFLRSQFDAQRAHYRAHYADSSFDVIEVNGESAGRLYLQKKPDDYRIVDIALLPDYRGSGIGSSLLRQIMQEAGERGLPVSIHVENNNPAMSLYRRLGFRKIDDNGVYHLMEWRQD